MSNWKQLSEKEQVEILRNIAYETGINENAIEKDWWVSITLKALFKTSCGQYLLFKGGTSLSKGWNLINRFSEDIDLAINRNFFGFSVNSKSQREKLRKKARNFIHTELSLELNEKLAEMGIKNYEIQNITMNDTTTITSDKDPTEIHINYQSVLEQVVDYIPPRVKIEISCLSMEEPYEDKQISSTIYETYPEIDDDTVSIIRTVLPSRTFLEKAFLLNEEFQKETPRHLRMSRHLYDLEKLMDTEHATMALADTDLYIDIIKHRSVFNKLSYVNYERHHPTTIDFLPPKEATENWKKDYDSMRSSFIYDTKPITYDELIKRMTALRERFSTIEIDAFSIN